MRREWIEIVSRRFLRQQQCSLPPCGGSGLKWEVPIVVGRKNGSPSMRREWIEIQRYFVFSQPQLVSLHAEGVD